MASTSKTPAYTADNAGPNPYAGVATDPAYAMETGQAPYLTESGWATDLAVTIGGTPDPDRLDRRVRVDRRASLRNPLAWWKKYTKDINARHDVESVDSDGWTTRRGQRHYAADPRWSPPAETRVTSSLAPSSYSFMRPFDQSTAREFNGQHFSMADHRRNYDIMGMAPVTHARNTYRTEPTPWDTDIVDVVPDTTNDRPRERVSSSLPAGGRSWRLG